MIHKKLGLDLKIRVWFERGGKRVLGPGRAELLGHIERHGSISAAAKQMNMSYRRAWSLVRSVNHAAGQKLVTVVTGGTGGGGAALTPKGREALALYRNLVNHLRRTATRVVRPTAFV